MADMRQYAERLNKVDSDRFHMPHTTDGWVMCDLNRGRVVSDRCSEEMHWALWGPLADEIVKPMVVDEYGDRGLYLDGRKSLLENIADAVCQEAERRVGPTP